MRKLSLQHIIVNIAIGHSKTTKHIPVLHGFIYVVDRIFFKQIHNNML